MKGETAPSIDPVIRLFDVRAHYGATAALDGVTLDLPSGRIIGVIGPDGVGKSTLFSLIAGARAVREGRIEVMGGDMADARHRADICPRVAFMPQGLGRNLYATLTVVENLAFFSRLFGQGAGERDARITALLAATGLSAFRDRPAGKLSGGMKQKLGLCCALIHDPDLLILDEPTTGVDPLSRAQFWDLIDGIRANRPGMSVLVATAYMEEAARFDFLIAMDGGKVLATGTAPALLARTKTATLEEAFIALLPEARRRGHEPVVIPPRPAGSADDVVIEARGLTMRFGDFTAVDHVDFRIERGEIFGFLGSNGCGKTTTMKLLTGLLAATEGEAWLFGQPLTAVTMDMRRRVGYMTQAFSLYAELTVAQNLTLHARLYGVSAAETPGRVAESAERFELSHALDALPDALPLGVRQRLSLAVAMVHKPELLILDEPTSGVDPIARDLFWRLMVDLSREDGVTIFISTHFMNEANRCDRISLMHAGRVLVCDTPEAVIASRGAAALEEAFISYLEDAGGGLSAPPTLPARAAGPRRSASVGFSPRRMGAYTRREALELRRDPIRGLLALFGSCILMLSLGLGLNFDVNAIAFAVLDGDGTVLSRDYAQSLAGSSYFLQKPPIIDHADLDHRMQSGELALAIELPSGFGRDVARGAPVEIAAWIDGALPQRGETIEADVLGLNQGWIAEQAARRGAAVGGGVDVAIRFRYNPDVVSIIAMAPAIIPILLLLIPAILTALSVVREKELGSIVNLYVTPVTRLEFLIGKQIPYVVLAMVNFVLLTLMATIGFQVPFTGGLGFYAFAAFLAVLSSTALGLLMSSFMKSQIAAIFGTMIATLIPALQYSGMINPISSMQGVGAVIGRVFPTTYFLVIARGAFSKALGFTELWSSLWPIALSVLVLMGLCRLALKKQEG